MKRRIQNNPAATLARTLMLGIGILLSCNVLAGGRVTYATTDALAAEATARENADTALQTNITAEANARGAADTALQGSIAAEASARGTADTNLQNQIDNLPLPTQYAIGDTGPGQGIVFFVSADGLHGLEAAPSDQDGGTGIQWDNGSYIATSAVRDGVNAGGYNTERIIITLRILGGGGGSYAALLCANYQGGGYGDWYLPSKAELNLMYTNIGQGSGNNVGGFADRLYWSSTEFDSHNAWFQAFDNGVQLNTYGKSPTLRVRAVRAF